MNRRDFLRTAPAIPAVVLAVPSTDNYRFAGYLRSGTIGAQGVARVTLNGQDIDRVFECDDVEGWLRRYVRDSQDTTALGDAWARRASSVRVERLEGTVRVHWKTP